MLAFFIFFFICIAISMLYLIYRQHVTSREEEQRLQAEEENAEETKPYGTNQRKRKFLTQSERKFKELLQQKLPSNIEIHCNVRLADILEKEIESKIDIKLRYDENNNGDIQYGQNYLMMHVDYVLIDKKTDGIICAIELDGDSHNGSNAQSRDMRKNNILNHSKIHLVRVPANKKYDQTRIQEIIGLCKNEMT